MNPDEIEAVCWQRFEVASPRLDCPVSVVAAKDIRYLPGGDRFQTLSLYLPDTSETTALIGTPVSGLPKANSQSPSPRYQVHIHGGAWRDPELTSASIEPTVAHAFSQPGTSPIIAIASVNYRLSPFPTRPTLPYDPVKDNHADPAREAVHPQHLSDVLHAFALLRAFGLADQSYILSGHSCGACLAFQAVLQPSAYYGLENLPDAPCPAAILGLNGLYDLPALVEGLDASHEHLAGDYETMLTIAFGADRGVWATASPARFDPLEIARRIRKGMAPRLIVLDESTDDQLVPMNQKLRLESNLGKVDGLQVVSGHRCTGSHAAPWEQGLMIWDSLRDIAELLKQK